MKKDLIKLEYDKIVNLIYEYCLTFNGKILCKSMIPFNIPEIVDISLKKTFLALNLFYRKGEPPFYCLENMDILFKNLRGYNTLSASSLLQIAKVLKTSRKLHEYFYSDTNFDLSEFSVLADLFSMLYFNKTVEDKISNSIIDENTIADDASSKLFSLRKNRRKLEQSVREKLSNFIHSSANSKYLMDNIVTIRNDRFVVPVKEEFKDYVSGSILDISSSGSTVYIEPSIVFELNNKINRLIAEEALEIEVILKNLSTILFPITDNISKSLNIIGELDFLFAKAKYSKKINGILPNINNKNMINLVNARHPLIDENIVVPINISLGDSYSSLLITGPNTGGKTVTLKTVGLLCSMACSGILIPASDNSSIYVFDNIYADIGDEQSIQESLSTFSSHIVNIIDILNKATSRSLILLDELGSGTDPVEGSSLAISILEYFHKIGASTICTTHYPELKKYALTHTGFENASSDFDVENLRPTYKLLIGVPGKSNAFAISRKLGLDEKILSRAQDFIQNDEINIEDLLKNIYNTKIDIEKEKEIIEKNSNQIEVLRKSLEKDNSKLNLEAQNIISNAKLKAREILLDAKEEAGELIKELNDYNINLREANNIRNKLNSSIKHLSTYNEVSNNSLERVSDVLTSTNIFLGQKVFYKNLNAEGVVSSLPNKSEEVKLELGSISVMAKISNLLIITDSDSDSVNKSNNITSKISFSNNKSQNIATEINVIGLNVDQAIPIVDKYIDDCYLANLEIARIVHGKGTGKLRKGIQSFLKNNPHIKSFRLGSFGEGGDGVTIIYFS